jgi:hypothetical protein
VTGAFLGSLPLKDNSDYQNKAESYLKVIARSFGETNGNGILIVSEVNRWALKTALDSIKAVFFSGQNLIFNRDEFKKVVKQASCIFMAESDFGNLPKNNYDNCDQTNIGQVRESAYREVLRQVQLRNFDDINIKAALGTDSDWNVLHPYEFPLCCNALFNDETRSEMHCNVTNDSKNCITPTKREYLENHDLMIQIPKEARSSSGTWDELKLMLHKAINKMPNVPKSPTSITMADDEDIHLDPVLCKGTSGKTYVRVPAVPSHSIFTTIAYMRAIKYNTHMSDSYFADEWAPEGYNNAGDTEKRKYRSKLQGCLSAMEKTNVELGMTNAQILNEYVDEYVDGKIFTEHLRPWKSKPLIIHPVKKIPLKQKNEITPNPAYTEDSPGPRSKQPGAF